MRKLISAALCSVAVVLSAGPAFAWGEIGHRVTVLIAYRHLTPAVRARVDALVKADTNTLVPHTLGDLSLWADKVGAAEHLGSKWHFADIEIDKPDVAAACYNFPAVAPGQASDGPADDCVIDKIGEFAAELRDPATTAEERQRAFRFLIHFVGDLHQPLHAIDHNDRGGNCVPVTFAGLTKPMNLHAFWDTAAVHPLGGSPEAIAAKLDARVTPEMVSNWSAGDTRAWAQESFDIAKAWAYDLPSRPTCADTVMPVKLNQTYLQHAVQVAGTQLAKGGVRLAWLLNQALG